MTGTRTRTSAVDVSGFVARPPEPADAKAVAQVIEDGPFKSREAPPAADAKRGRPSTRGPTATVYARISVPRFELLKQICEDKGWTNVVALERAIDALAAQEGAR